MSDSSETAGRPDTVAPAIELRGMSKSFGHVQANKDISMRVMPGTIHGIIGENGAGKSTLMSILYGFYKADAGEILVGGEVTEIPDSQAAIAAGIGMVFQHFKLVENFTVLENVILGAEDGTRLKPSLARARSLLTELAREYELNVDPDERIEDLSVGHQQRVEILKALYRHADILILDEPTGVLTPSEADHLFRILKGLRDEGKTIILITHKLREIMDVTDTVSVMRRGEMTATVRTAGTSPQELAELMVGRKVLLRVDKKPAEPGRKVLEIEDLRVVDDDGVERLKGIDLELRQGEILGIAGVAGNGQSELLQVLGGCRNATGRIRLNDEDIDPADHALDGQVWRGPGRVPRAGGPAARRTDPGFLRVGECRLRLPPRPGVPEVALAHGQRRHPTRIRQEDGAFRCPSAYPRTGGKELLGRQPAEDRAGARDRA